MSNLTCRWSLALVVGVLVPSCLRSQQVTVSAAAATQLLAWTWSYVGTYQATSAPPGPLARSGEVSQVGFGPGAGLAWQQVEGPDSIAFALQLDAAGGGSLFQCGIGAFTLVLDVGSTSARAIELDLARTSTATMAGVPPTISIDVGNDGSIEYADVAAGGAVTIPTLSAGPAPLQIAIAVSEVRLDAFTGHGTLADELRVVVRPDNDLDIVKEADGCVAGQPGFDEPTPVFAGHGVALNFSPGLLVVGLQPLPIVWTPTSPLPFVGTCLVVPSPDILIWEPSGALRLGLPLAVRPATVHVQAAFLTPLGVGASDGYRIVAN